MTVFSRFSGRLEDLLDKERSLPIIGIAAPLLGVIGTVPGMVRTLCVIAVTGTALTVAEIIDAIKFSFGVTLVGLAIVIPIILAASRLCVRKHRS